MKLEDYDKYWGNPPWEWEYEEAKKDYDLDKELEKETKDDLAKDYSFTPSEYEKYTGKKWEDEDEEETDPYISGDELRDYWISEIMDKVYAHNTSLFRAWVAIVILAVLMIILICEPANLR